MKEVIRMLNKEQQINITGLVNHVKHTAGHWVDANTDQAITVFNHAEDISPMYDASDDLIYIASPAEDPRF